MGAQSTFLKSKFQVGSAKSDRINYSLAQKVFHSSDVPDKTLLAKKEVLKAKQRDILSLQQPWNQSTIADPKIQKDIKLSSDLKRTLLKVRAGLMDQVTLDAEKKKTSGGGATNPATTALITGNGRPEEELEDLIRYMVAITGRGPIGKHTGRWCNAIDERGLAS